MCFLFTFLLFTKNAIDGNHPGLDDALFVLSTVRCCCWSRIKTFCNECWIMDLRGHILKTSLVFSWFSNSSRWTIKPNRWQLWEERWQETERRKGLNDVSVGSIQVFFGKRVHRNLQGGRVPVAHGSQAGALCRRARIDEEGGRAPLAGDESRADTTLLETKKTEKRKKGLSNAWRSAWRRCVLPRSVRRFLRFCRAYNSGTTRQKKRSCLIDTVRVSSNGFMASSSFMHQPDCDVNA